MPFVPGPKLSRLALRVPFKGLFLGRPVVRDGQTLDRTIQWLLALERLAKLPPLSAKSVTQARAASARTMVLLTPTDRRVGVHDATLPGPAGPVPIRRYRPPGLGESGLPTLLYLHGGGWVIGDLDTHDGVCRALAAQAGCQVIAVDYRLAPEHPYPAPVEDCWAALQALLEQPDAHGVDPARVAVGGDSAGGNLSAVLALRARDAGLPLCLQLLIYPGTDQSCEATSFETFADGFLLTRDDIRWFRNHYLPDPIRRTEPDASPLLAEDVAGVAPAYVATAGYDPLRDEGQAYAERLAAGGVSTQAHCFPDLVHGYLNIAGAVPAAARAFAHASAALRTALEVAAP